eukprot:1399250-Alexandrium_andersonii.AAC.1
MGPAHVYQESRSGPTPAAAHAAPASGNQVGQQEPERFQKGRGRERGVILVEGYDFGLIATTDIGSRRAPR